MQQKELVPWLLAGDMKSSFFFFKLKKLLNDFFWFVSKLFEIHFRCLAEFNSVMEKN